MLGVERPDPTAGAGIHGVGDPGIRQAGGQPHQEAVWPGFAVRLGVGRFDSVVAFRDCVRPGTGGSREAAKPRRGPRGMARAEARRRGEDRFWT